MLNKLSVFSFLTLPLLAQIGGTGSIQGIITDPSGAVVPGVSVTAINQATQIRVVRQSTAAGFYVLSPLAPGKYSVAITSGGFQPAQQDNVIVDALSTVSLNITLKIGATTDAVTVTDTPPPLNTSDARVGQTIRNEVYTALPLAMANAPRDPAAFVQFMPGVVPGGNNAAGQVSGAQGNSQDVYVEGIPVTNSTVQGEVRTLGLGISVEAVDQFQLETGGAAVMYGGQGATNFVLKSGTNKFHGAGYEFFRNTLLDARGFFPAFRAPEHQNEFGANLGGPIKRNKLFFFSSYDKFYYRTGTAATLVTLPTAGQRTGDFSGLPVAVFDPLTTANGNGINSRQAFPANQLPASRLSAASKFFAAGLPLPTQSGLQTNYLGSLPTGFNNVNTTNKVDYNLNDSHSLFFLFSRGHRSQSNSYRGAGNSLPLPYADTRIVDEVPTTAQIRHTFVISPTLINQASYGFSRLWVPITNATIDGDWMTKAGVRGLPAGEAASSFPEVAFAGPNSVTGWRGINSRAFTEALNNFTFQDNVQWTHGKHAVTVGLQLQWLQANVSTNAYGSIATWNFSNTQTAGFNPQGTLLTATGNSYASYLLGAVNNAAVTEDSVVGTGARYGTYAYWIQDNFKVNNRLTLNLGLRHDIMLPHKEVLDRVSFFNPDAPNSAAGGIPGILQFMGNGTNSCNCRTTIKTHYKNFGPRIGINYMIDSKTVIRTAYSIMYTRRGAVGGRGGGRTGTGTLGFSASPSFISLDQGISPAFYWDNGVPGYEKPPFTDPTFGTAFNGSGRAGSTMQYGDPDIGGHPPRYQNWNFGFERAITASLTLGVNYVGGNGHYLSGGGRSEWSAQIHPRFLALGNLLQAQATPANIASANNIVSGIKLPFSNFVGTISQMLRPFPQYPNVSDLWGEVANSNYNSLQITLNKRLSKGLVFNTNYTFAKAFGDDAGARSGYNWRTEKAQQVDPTHVINALFVYSVPFKQKVIANWHLSGITTYRSGQLFGTIAANCLLPNAGGCYADYTPGFTGALRINGDYGSGDVRGTSYVERAAFANPAAFNYGNTPRTGAFGLRGPSNSNQSLSLKREFVLHEGIKFSLQADAFNVFNWVRFASPNLNITNANFGRITGVANSPRAVQFNARISF